MTAPDFLAECPTRLPKGRLHKVECEGCGYVGRVTAKWLDRYGAAALPLQRGVDAGLSAARAAAP